MVPYLFCFQASWTAPTPTSCATAPTTRVATTTRASRRCAGECLVNTCPLSYIPAHVRVVHNVCSARLEEPARRVQVRRCAGVFCVSHVLRCLPQLQAGGWAGPQHHAPASLCGERPGFILTSSGSCQILKVRNCRTFPSPLGGTARSWPRRCGRWCPRTGPSASWGTPLTQSSTGTQPYAILLVVCRLSPCINAAWHACRQRPLQQGGQCAAACTTLVEHQMVMHLGGSTHAPCSSTRSTTHPTSVLMGHPTLYFSTLWYFYPHKQYTRVTYAPGPTLRSCGGSWAWAAAWGRRGRRRRRWRRAGRWADAGGMGRRCQLHGKCIVMQSKVSYLKELLAACRTC